MQKILFFITEAEYFISHRIGIATHLKQNGFEVAIMTTGTSEQFKLIKDNEIKVFPLKHLKRSSINPIRELLTLLEVKKIIKDYKPNILHNVAIKPIIYGSLCKTLQSNLKVINAFAGLGYLFTANNLKRKVLKAIATPILKSLLNDTDTILQNQDDIDTLKKQEILRSEHIHLIKGSGIDTDIFKYTNMPNNDICNITIGCRVLKDKGILEVIEAAKKLKENKIPAEINLFGTPDKENPSSIKESLLKKWHNEGLINWHGKVSSMLDAYKNCDIAILASYREGLPRTLLEAAAIGRPIITTDVPGCREVVLNQENGFLIPAKNSKALYDAIVTLVKDKELKLKMARNSHKIVSKNFSNNVIFKQTLELYDTIAAK